MLLSEANLDCSTFFMDYIGADENSVQTPTPVDSSPVQGLPLEVPKRMAKAKRNRTVFTADQLVELEKEYEDSNYLDRTKRIQVARKLSLSERQVKVWFQNKRMKNKKDGKLEKNIVRERRQQRVQLQLQENERPFGQLSHLRPCQQPQEQSQELSHLLLRQQPRQQPQQQLQQQCQQQPQQLSHLVPHQQSQQKLQQQPQQLPHLHSQQQPLQQLLQQPKEEPLQQPLQQLHLQPQPNNQQPFGVSSLPNSSQCREQFGQQYGQQYGNVYQDTNEHQFRSSCTFSGNAILQDPICRESENPMDSGLHEEMRSLGLQYFAPTTFSSLGEILSDLEDIFPL